MQAAVRLRNILQRARRPRCPVCLRIENLKSAHAATADIYVVCIAATYLKQITDVDK